MSRKRPAPDHTQSQIMQQSSNYGNIAAMGDASQMSDDQFLQWGANNAAEDSSLLDVNTIIPHNGAAASAQPINSESGARYVAPSSQLVRRNPNQPLSQRSDLFSNQDIATMGDNGVDNASDESESELERKAAAARKDAQSKRPPKQIPPFIQKLSSFLDDTKNEELIRWSDDGKTFIVLDEETFANTLIPELFKHKNFASFVRQLNMYGFHKVLGLADNSMRASEKKSKNPSQYRHKYFRRGRPDLLWMVTKPKPETQLPKKKKRKTTDDVESEDEGDRHEDGDGMPTATHAPGKGAGAVSIPRQQWHNIQTEIAQLKQSQQHINKMIARFQHENNQYIRQASSTHERHEHSINAILTFLATFYRRSLDENDVGNMFSNAIPQAQPHRNVEDVGDFVESPTPQQTQFPRQLRRPQLLLGPPDSPRKQNQTSQTQRHDNPIAPTSEGQQHESFLAPQSAGGLARSRPQSNRSSNHSSPAEATYDNFSDATLPQRARVTQQRQQQPADTGVPKKSPTPTNNNEMMSMIHKANQNQTNASDTTNFDFSSALRHFENANGNNPLSAEERNNMLSLMANNSGTTTPTANNAGSALFNPNTFRGSSEAATADYNQFLSNNESISALQRLQQQQHDKVQSLAGRLQPLSPSGSIPGLALSGDQGADLLDDNNFGAPGDFDLNSYINSDYFPEYDGGDGKFDFDNQSYGNISGNEGASASFNTDGILDHTAEQRNNVTGTATNQSELYNAESGLANDDTSLFGSSNEATPQTDNPVLAGVEPSNSGDIGDTSSSTGKVLGSVGSSSGLHSPAIDESNDFETSAAAQHSQRGSKRRSQRLQK